MSQARDVEKPVLDTEKPLRVLRSELKAINLLMETEGFALWSTVMAEQEQGRISTLYQPIDDSNKVYGQEFLKGEMQGIRMSVLMWTLLKETLAATIEEKESSMTAEEREQDEGREE